jgi:MOSC domain-containing protein YiiM
MTTLAQPGLPRDIGLLQTVARHNRVDIPGLGQWACAGAYGRVLTPGPVQVGDPVTVTAP